MYKRFDEDYNIDFIFSDQFLQPFLCKEVGERRGGENEILWVQWWGRRLLFLREYLSEVYQIEVERAE